MKKLFFYILIFSFLLTICSAFILSSAALAAPIWGEILELKQVDGTAVQVRIWGDEFYQVVESLDGYTLIRDSITGIICYASLSPDGNDLVSTGITLSETAPVGLGLDKHIRINEASRKAKIAAARARLLGGGNFKF